MTAPQDPARQLPPARPRPADPESDPESNSVTAPETDSATLLDQEVWQTPGATVELPPAPAASPAPAPAPPGATVELRAAPALPAGEEVPADEDGLRRFGPGVPSPAADVPPLVAALWRGGDRPAPAGERARRDGSRWLLPVLVLLAVLIFLIWQWWPNPVALTGASVRTDPAGPACDGTATVIGTLDTDGGAGIVTYRWRRSDGTLSADLTQSVPRGSRHTDVVLRWTFEGKGTMAATATLEVLSPAPRTAAASFTYTCR